MTSMDIYTTESSGVDTSPDMNSSVEEPRMSSPVRQIVQPRKLTFGMSPEPENNPVQKDFITANLTVSPKKHPSISPPCRGVRALRLFDSPATPKTIIEKSNTSKYMKFLSSNRLADSSSDCLAKPFDVSTPLFAEKPRAIPLHITQEVNLSNAANLNPFTPKGMQNIKHNKRTRTDSTGSYSFSFGLNSNSSNVFCKTQKHRYSGVPVSKTHSEPLINNSIHNTSTSPPLQESSFPFDDDCDVRQAPKRLALQDSNISRYEKEFLELRLIGVGEFGLVYHCLNRLDGCEYAVKKSIKPVAGSVFEKTALNEVYAHAVLGKHENVVRYYSAWAENNHMLIQNEYCNGGSLQAVLEKRHMSEMELRTLLMHVAEGLKYIHSNDLVHMDLKAGNIFLTKDPNRTACADSCDDGFEEVLDEFENEHNITYKIGDLGHVTSVNDPQVEEGDCRYLPNEILQEDFTHLQKADIFSLGITLYEAAGGGPLPKNGPEWHRLRNGNAPDLPNLSRQFNDLIKLMIHPDPSKRPSSTTIFNHPLLSPLDNKTKAQLSHELCLERQKTECLKKKLLEMKKVLKSYELSKTPGKRAKNSPITSDRKLRSYSRKRQRHTSYTANRRGLRDSNKNFINNFDF